MMTNSKERSFSSVFPALTLYPNPIVDFFQIGPEDSS